LDCKVGGGHLDFPVKPENGNIFTSSAFYAFIKMDDYMNKSISI